MNAHNRKISESRKGQHNSLGTEIKEGQHLSLATEIKSGEHLSPKTEFKKGQTAWNFGKKTSEETKRKLSTAHNGKKHTEESKRKMSVAQTGSNNPHWKGGQTKDRTGYILIWIPGHPLATKTNYVRRSHLVMEKMIGRYIQPREIVHHKGTKYLIASIENRQDDRPENLMLFSTSRAHIKYHFIQEGTKKGEILFDGHNLAP